MPVYKEPYEKGLLIVQFEVRSQLSNFFLRIILTLLAVSDQMLLC